MEFDKARVFTALNADEIKIGSEGYFADSIRILKETIKETLKDSCAAAYGEIDEIKDDSCSCRFSIKKILHTVSSILLKNLVKRNTDLIIIQLKYLVVHCLI